MKKEDLFDVLVDVNSQYVKEARMHNKNNSVIRWAKWGALAACFAVLVFCVPMISNLSSMQGDNESTNESSLAQNDNKTENVLQSTEELATKEEFQSRIEELSLTDSLGWIVYDNKIYIQDLNIDTISLENNKNTIELSECLGRASDYVGVYKNTDACDGDVYLVASDSNILCIELDNGATIWLGVECTTN